VAFSGLGFVIGDLFTFLVLYNVTMGMDPSIQFGITGLCGAFAGIVVLFMIKEPNMDKIH